MIFNKKNIFKNILVWMLLFITLGLNLSATTAEDIESLTAFLRIPAAIGVNTLGKQSGVAPKIILIVSDLIRLSNEMLSIVNKRGKNDFHHYDYFWGAYDFASLGLHLNDLLSKIKMKKQIATEFVKLQGMLQTLHEMILPVLEGGTACLAAANKETLASDEKFRLRCKSINSLVRVLDNLIISKPKSYEQYAFASLLCVNIVLALYDCLGVAWFKSKWVEIRDKIQEPLRFASPDCMFCGEDFKVGDEIVRLACCGQTLCHSEKCLRDFENKADPAVASKCPFCKRHRDVSKEKEVILTQENLDSLKK